MIPLLLWFLFQNLNLDLTSILNYPSYPRVINILKAQEVNLLTASLLLAYT